jgi:hypothetical protein
MGTRRRRRRRAPRRGFRRGDVARARDAAAHDDGRATARRREDERRGATRAREDVGDGAGGEETTRKRRRRMDGRRRTRAGTRRTTRGTRGTTTTTTTTTTTMVTDDARAMPRWRTQDEELPANSEELQQAIKDWLTKKRTAAGKVKQVLGLLNHERLGYVCAQCAVATRGGREVEGDDGEVLSRSRRANGPTDRATRAFHPSQGGCGEV